MTNLNYSVVREVMLRCDIKISENCFLGESFVPMEIQTVKDALNTAHKEGWCIRNHKCCCPSCKKYIELFGLNSSAKK